VKTIIICKGERVHQEEEGDVIITITTHDAGTLATVEGWNPRYDGLSVPTWLASMVDFIRCEGRPTIWQTHNPAHTSGGIEVFGSWCDKWSRLRQAKRA
jgi:hypothetical protein